MILLARSFRRGVSVTVDVHDSTDSKVEAGSTLCDTDLHSLTILRVGVHVYCIVGRHLGERQLDCCCQSQDYISLCRWFDLEVRWNSQYSMRGNI